MRLPALLSLALLTALLPTAAAQVPSTGPIPATLTLTGLPTELKGLDSNKSLTFSFTVDYRATGNVVCPSASTVRITLAAAMKTPASFVTVSVNPSEITVPLAQGAVQNPAGGGPATLHVNVTEVLANATIPIEVTASATANTACPPGIGAATGTATGTATVVAPPTPPPPPPPVEETPGPGVLLGVVALVVAAVALRRKG